MDQKNHNRIDEDDLHRIIKKVLREQSVIGAPDRGTISTETDERKRLHEKYSCIPYIYQPFVVDLLSKGYDKKFIKAALGVIGRESDYGQSTRARAKSFIQFIGDILSVTPGLKKVGKNIKSNLGSKGMAQMKMQTAKKFKVDPNTIEGSLVGPYRYLMSNYKLAKSKGYDPSKPSSNYSKGTGDGALDMALIGYNQGESFIHKYCETSDPKRKSDCVNAGKKIKLKYGPEVKVTNKEVKNYLPYYKSKNSRHYTGLLTSWGYVKEVAERMKTFNCI